MPHGLLVVVLILSTIVVLTDGLANPVIFLALVAISNVLALLWPGGPFVKEIKISRKRD